MEGIKADQAVILIRRDNGRYSVLERVDIVDMQSICIYESMSKGQTLLSINNWVIDRISWDLTKSRTLS